MTDLADLVSGAKFRADMQQTNRVLNGEWAWLVRDAIKATWNQASQARPDFQFTSSDFALVSGGEASTPLPRNFHALIDVVFSPDTQNEYSLGPFAWQNRRAVGGWWPWGTVPGLSSGGTRAHQSGDKVYVEPSFQAAGSYRLWYCPRAHTPDIVARLATAAALPACTAAGAGVGKTLTGNALGLLSVDSQAVALNDVVLVKNQVATQDNGVYVVTAPGSAGTAFVLLRSTSFDATAEVAVGDIVAVGQTNAFLDGGTLNEGKFYTVATFTAIESAMTFTEGAALEPILDQFSEAVIVGIVIPALMRDGGASTTPVSDWKKHLFGDPSTGAVGLMGELRAYFAMVRSVGPVKTIDTDAVGAGAARWG